jgi:hypothetical protein
MPCSYLWTTAVRMRHQVTHRAAQRSRLLQNLTNLIVQSRSILNAPPQLQVLSAEPENAFAECKSTLQSSRVAWKHLEVLRSTGEVARSVWEVWVWFRTDWHFADEQYTAISLTPVQRNGNLRIWALLFSVLQSDHTQHSPGKERQLYYEVPHTHTSS